MEGLIDTFGIDWRLIAVQIFNFAILLGALTYLLYKPVLKIIDDRRKVVAKGVEDAEAAKAKLAASEGEAKTIRDEAHRNADGIVARAKEAAGEEAGDIVAAARRQSARLEDEARARAEAEAAAIKARSEKEIAETAILAAERILREKA